MSDSDDWGAQESSSSKTETPNPVNTSTQKATSKEVTKKTEEAQSPASTQPKATDKVLDESNWMSNGDDSEEKDEIDLMEDLSKSKQKKTNLTFVNPNAQNTSINVDLEGGKEIETDSINTSCWLQEADKTNEKEESTSKSNRGRGNRKGQEEKLHQRGNRANHQTKADQDKPRRGNRQTRKQDEEPPRRGNRQREQESNFRKKRQYQEYEPRGDDNDRGRGNYRGNRGNWGRGGYNNNYNNYNNRNRQYRQKNEEDDGAGQTNSGYRGNRQYDRNDNNRDGNYGNWHNNRNRDDNYNRNRDDNYNRNRDDNYNRNRDENYNRNREDNYNRNREDNYNRNGGGNYNRNRDDDYNRNRDQNYGRNREDNYRNNDNYNRNRDDNYNRNYNNNVEPRREEPKEETRVQTKVETKVQVKETTQQIQPKGRRCWPQTAINILNCKVVLTARQLTDFRSKLLVFPYSTIQMEYYPGNVINSSTVDYRKKIMQKGAQIQSAGSVYLQKAIGVFSFQAIAFIKIDKGQIEQSLRKGIFDVLRSVQKIQKPITLETIVFPICYDLGDPSWVLMPFLNQLQFCSKAKQVWITTIDGPTYIKAAQTFNQKLQKMFEANQIYLA